MFKIFNIFFKIAKFAIFINLIIKDYLNKPKFDQMKPSNVP
jgi:hypothetical protein